MNIMKQKIKNLFSRKFILSAAIVITGIGTVLKTASNPSIQITGILAACVASIVYNLIEGMVDSNAIKAQVEKAIEEVQNVKKKDEKVSDHE